MKLRGVLAVVFALALTTIAVDAAVPGNMIGRQSQNEGILVLPVRGDVTIDGKLDDWDLSGRIWVFADKNVRSRFATEVSAMWTASALYIAVQWQDPTPMFSMIDPEFNPNDGWKADSLQLRVSTEDRTSWLTTWYFAGKQQPVLHVSTWQDYRNSRKGQDVTLLAAAPGGTDLGSGAEMAYVADPDGAGYVQEIKIPWSLIYQQPPEMKAGVIFRMGMEFLWGDPTGKTWPIHRYADNLQPGHTSREFFWTATRAWGDATLVAEGNVPVRKYVQAGSTLAGTVPIRLTIPRDAARFTIVIDDQSGNRVRSLGGLDPIDYTVAEAGDERTVEVLWDGLTDKVWGGNYQQGFSGAGKLVAPGIYRVRGLYHKGLSAEYEMCFYNPGTPPWPVANGSGAWGADHAVPLRLARAGDWMIASWAFAEGGSGIIGIAPDGLKNWGEKRGGLHLAADDSYVYAVPAGWHLKQDVLIRLDKKKGSYAPFALDGKPRPFELPMRDILEGEDTGPISAIAVHGQVLAIAYGQAAAGRLALLDVETAAQQSLLTTPILTGLAFTSSGQLLALSDGQPVAVDLTTGKTTAIAAPGLGRAAAIAVDLDDNIVLADTGADSQVKAYSPAGTLVYTCGKKGGRPIRGKFEPQAMMRMKSVAVDSQGQVWVTESWELPRRISIWGRDGKLVRDYIGNTGYAAQGSYIHDQDPTLGYVGPVEIRLDQATRTWQVSQILWQPDAALGESFPIPTAANVLPQRFRSDVSGTMREYLYVHDPRDGAGNVVFMARDGDWTPVAAVCLAAHISGDLDRSGVVLEEPGGELAGLNAYDGVFWHDANGDGKVQRSECEIVKTERPGRLNDKDGRTRGQPPFPLGNGWGGRIGRDLVFYLDGINRVAPVRFTDDGAPVYTSESLQPIGQTDNGDLVPVPAEDLLICISWKGYAGPTRVAGIDTKTGALRWTYPNPYPGVHGSHRATMPEPGVLIGPLKNLGVVSVNEEVGRVFAMRGNLGQDFFMTTDGIFVGTMFEDGRLPGMTLPSSESQLIGMPMEAFSNGGEPFNGCLVKHDDGKIRMSTGFPREAAMVLQVKGLETIGRFEGAPLQLDAQALAGIDADNQARAAAAAKSAARTYTIKRLTPAPRLDGNDRDWQGIPEVKISRTGSPETGTARLAYDDQMLYVLFNVNDASAWRNAGRDFDRLFKTGDAVDIQLSPSGNKSRDPVEGDLRIVIANLNRRPAAVVMQPKSAGGAMAPKTYVSPVSPKVFDRVEVIASAQIEVTSGAGTYRVEAAIPLADLGLPATGKLTGDLGFISSDADGRINTARTYWANTQTNLVNDEPSEAWFSPSEWGEMVFE